MKHSQAELDSGESMGSYLEKRAEIFERRLRAKNSIRMQELLDEESFDRWNRRRLSSRKSVDKSA